MAEDAFEIALRLRIDDHERKTRELVVYGYYQGCTDKASEISGEVECWDCLRKAMAFAGISPSDENEFHAMRQQIRRYRKDASKG